MFAMTFSSLWAATSTVTVRPIGCVDINVGMALESEEAVQGKKIMAHRVDANDCHNCEKEVNHCICVVAVPNSSSTLLGFSPCVV